VALNIVIIASGQAYQEAAASSAPTYTQQLGDRARVVVLVPAREPVCEELRASRQIYGFNLRRFPFVQVSQRKFTSQLKCQGYMHTLANLNEDDFVLFADADTCCLKRISIPIHIAQEVAHGRIGMVADIEDRHFKLPEDPWYLTEQERLTYVNSGVILASRKALPMFHRFRSLSEDERFLWGPFNDQKVINYALGKDYRDGLLLLDRKYNWIGPPFSPAAMIGHFAGGAGYLGEQRRKISHHEWCEETKKGRASGPPRR
jgi:hypothetical protein